MKLILRLADPDQDGAGESRELHSGGRLNIGRGAENDWVLADPDRTLSKNHCRVDASEGGFMLTDLSTNGVFLAGSAQPVGRGRSCALEQGDSFMLGPYWMHAEIVDESEGALRLERGLGLPQGDMDEIFPGRGGAPAGTSPLTPAVAEPWLPEVPSAGFGPDRRAAPAGWDAPPDPAAYAATGMLDAPAGMPQTGSDLFSQQSEHIAASGNVMRVPKASVVLPMDWNEADSGQGTPTAPAEAVWPPALPESPVSIEQEVLPSDWVAAEPAPTPPVAWAPAPAAAPAIPPDWSAAPVSPRAVPAASVPPAVPQAAPQQRTRPAPRRAAPPPPPPPPPEPVMAAPPAAAAPADLAQAFLEGAGLAPTALDGLNPAEAMREAGRMLRAAVEGARDILSTRALLKSEFRVEQTVLRRSDNNAMKFAPDAQRCLAAMVGAPPPGFVAGAAAMQQSMEDIKAHELALVAALNSVFGELDRQLEPEAIMKKARADQSFATMLPYAREAKCWAIYVETYRLLQESGAANTGGTLLAPLARAYGRQLRRGG